MSRSNHGDLFLLADRRNRLERARLDRQLKGIDKDCARNEFLIERQKRTLVNKWQGVSRTTGHSEKGLPPDGPRDNVYDKSKYNSSRLSEKRLMEWKVRERQLEKFLKQFHPARPPSGPAGIRPRPSSSRSETSTTTTSPGCGRAGWAASASSSSNKSQVPAGRVRPATAVHQHHDSKPRRRCASAVSFSSRVRTISQENGDCSSEAGDKDFGNVVEDRESEGQSDSEDDRVFQTRLRSLSMVAMPQHYVRLQNSRCATAKHRPSEASSRTDVFEAFKDKTTAAALNTAEVIEQFKSCAKNYEDFVRAQSVSDTKFFVTKDSVVMTDSRQQKCRELTVSHSMTDLTDKPPRQGSSRPCSDPKEAPASQADRMSLSSVSSEDLADNVFLGQEDQTEAVELPSSDTVQTGQRTFTEDLKRTDEVPNSQTQDQDHTWASRQSNVVQDVADQQTASSKEHVGSKDKASVSWQSVSSEGETCRKNNEDPPVFRPKKKLSVTDKKDPQVKDRSKGLCSKHDRRHSCHSALHHEPCTTTPSNKSRGHSGSVEREASERSPQTLLMKRQQSKTALHNHRPQSAKPSSFTSSMIITSLLADESCQSDIKENNRAVRTNRPSSAKPRRPSSSSHTDLKLSSSSQHSRNSHTDPQSTSPDQQKKNSSADSRLSSSNLKSKNTNPPPPEARPLTSNQQRRDSHSDSQIHPPGPQPNRNPQRPLNTNWTIPQVEDINEEDVEDPNAAAEEARTGSQWRRDLELEQPTGLSSRVSTLGTVLKAAMVFSKAARKKALSTMVEENNMHTHEAIRRERLRTLQSRASVLSKIVAQFPVQGNN